jgi:hypothetical protein
MQSPGLYQSATKGGALLTLSVVAARDDWLRWLDVLRCRAECKVLCCAGHTVAVLMPPMCTHVLYCCAVLSVLWCLWIWLAIAGVDC